MRVSLDWDRSFAFFGVKLTERGKRILIVAEQGVKEIAEKSLKTVKELTPANTGKLKAGWEIKRKEKSVGGLSYGVTYGIVNKDPKANATILYRGGKTNLLDILEYGTSPHLISPRRFPFLRFEVDGTEVFTKKVMHPGTRPYAMRRTAHLEATRDAIRLAARLQGIIGGALT